MAGQATLGTTSHFEGVILSMTRVTFQTGASMNYPGAEPRSIKWNLLFPTQRVGVLNQFDK